MKVEEYRSLTRSAILSFVHRQWQNRTTKYNPIPVDLSSGADELNMGVVERT